MTPTPRVLEVAAMFGLGIDEERRLTIIPPTTITLRAGEIIFVTGPSGSGKSSILHVLHEHMPDALELSQMEQADARGRDVPLVDRFDETLEETIRVLSIAGLADAFVMLRTPAQLSDGQRFRYRMARLIAEAERRQDGELVVCVADEFCSALDRVTACALARNVRRWVSRMKSVCFVAATAHDDLMDDLEPDVLLHKDLDGQMALLTREVRGSC